MATLTEWARPVLEELADTPVQVTERDQLLIVSWPTPTPGRQNRRSRPIWLQIEQNVADAVNAAEEPELPRLRRGLRRLLEARLSDYDVSGGPAEFHVVVDDHVLDV